MRIACLIKLVGIILFSALANNVALADPVFSEADIGITLDINSFREQHKADCQRTRDMEISCAFVDEMDGRQLDVGVTFDRHFVIKRISYLFPESLSIAMFGYISARVGTAESMNYGAKSSSFKVLKWTLKNNRFSALLESTSSFLGYPGYVYVIQSLDSQSQNM